MKNMVIGGFRGGTIVDIHVDTQIQMLRNRYIYHFNSLTVEAGFYCDNRRVIGFFTKLSNVLYLYGTL